MSIGAPPRPLRRHLAVALLLPALALGACSEDSGDSKPKPAPHTTTDAELMPGNVTSSTSGVVDVTVDVPVKSLAMGIAVQTTTGPTIQGFIEHAGLFLGGVDSILGPDGAVPYAFPRFDLDGNGSLESPLPVALNNEAVALHFPNDGHHKHELPAGTYSFPVGAADLDGILVSETLTPYVYYKTETAQRPTLKLNVVVLEGASGSITSDASASADPEIQGALSVLTNVYDLNENIDVNLDVTVDYVTNAELGSPLATPGVIATDSEQFALLQSYPVTPTHDAMNIFILASLDNRPSGVIGLAAGIPGPFNRHGTATSGTLAEYQGDGTGNILGFTLAHEFGHFLGLFHTSQTSQDSSGDFSIIGKDPISDTKRCKTKQVQKEGSIDNCPDRTNLMFPFVDNNDNPPVSIGQGNVVKFNPGITVP